MKISSLISRLLSIALTVSAVSTSVQAKSVLFTDFARDANGKILRMRWDAAKNYCQSTRVPGRLPTIRELAEHYNDADVTETPTHPSSRPVTIGANHSVYFYYTNSFYKPVQDESIEHRLWSSTMPPNGYVAWARYYYVYIFGLKYGDIDTKDMVDEHADLAVRCVIP